MIEEEIQVAEAVAASAAFPLLLPAVERRYTFHHLRDGTRRVEPVFLADGGVYDNLGLSVLEPGRSSEYTPHVYDLDYVFSCDAGRGRLPTSSRRFGVFRLIRSSDTVYQRVQDAARARLHEAAAARRITGFVQAYLGMRDDRLPIPVPDLVPLDDVKTYRTDFRAMRAGALDAISLRGEQLTRVLLGHYCPQLQAARTAPNSHTSLQN